MNKTTLAVIFALSLLFLASHSYAEYLRATNKDEIILVSTATEVKMGKSLSKNVEKKFSLDDDVFLQKRIGDIGQGIASVCDRKDITYYFKVILGEKLKPEERINAFALPGGYIYIFRDMVELLESDDEIAAILAHEVGHIAAKHTIKRLQSSLGALALQIIASRAAQDNGEAGKTNYAIGQLMMSYSREDENMADKLSVRYLKKAGYAPEAIIKTIDKMSKKRRKIPVRQYSAFRTHPYLSERRSAVKKEIYGRMDFVDFINTPAVAGEQ